MRRFLIVLGVVALCTAPTWADSVELDVNAWATFTSAATKQTDTIAVNFLYIPDNLGIGSMVPGSLTLSNSGFLGTFNNNCAPCSDYYVGFFSALGDEIDLDWTPTPSGGFSIQPGINTVSFYMWGCQSADCVSADCVNAEGTSWIGEGPGSPTKESSVVTAVAIADGDSFLWLSLAALASVGLVWRWRRRPEQILAR
jgi:hypothetical protein